MEQKRLYITLDTEMDADPHWNKKFPAEFSSIIQGIPMYLRPIWDKYQVCPIYFVSPEVLENKEACDVLKSEVTKGAVIGAHLHPEYIEPQYTAQKGKPSNEYPCFSCSTEIEKAKLLNLTNKIQDTLGVKPIWYRAARFGADEDTWELLAELGYQYDSSVTPGINWEDKGGGPDFSKYSYEPFEFQTKNGKNIMEYPVTIIGKRLGKLGKILPDKWLFYNWMRPTHMFLFEQKRIIKYAKKNNLKVLVVMFHTMEIMINTSPYVRNKFMQKYFLWRLDRTIKYAVKQGYLAGE